MAKSNNFIYYPIFSSFPEIKAFTSTKQTLNKGTVRFSNNPENCALLAQQLHLSPEQLIFPLQTHSIRVARIDSLSNRKLEATDALVSNISNLCLCIQTADCVPVLFYDPEKKVIAAAHAGWRGTVGRIVSKVITSMQQYYGSRPEHIRAAIGPSIGPSVYEVGEEVIEAVHQAIPNAANTLRYKNKSKAFFNLWEANKQLLLQSGLFETHIYIEAQCTFTHSDRYFSARREGIATGRLVSGIILKASESR